MVIKDYLYSNKQKLKRFFRNLFMPGYKQVEPFYVQKVALKRYKNRLNFFKMFCEGKRVIHFGCTDWPIFNPNNNLHIKLAEFTRHLDGFDIDKNGIDNLKKYVDQNYYTNIEEVPQLAYDVCLVPETIEHVDNVAQFLKEIALVNSKTYLITAPNCFAKNRSKRNVVKQDYMIELVHPDHNCWYSPYTLKNQIEKYSDLKVVNVYLLEDERMICCEAVKALK